MVKKTTVIAETAIGVLLLAGGAICISNDTIRGGIVETYHSITGTTSSVMSGNSSLQNDDGYEKSESGDDTTSLPDSIAKKVKSLKEKDANFKLIYPNGSGDFYIAQSEGVTAVFNSGDYKDSSFITRTLKNYKISNVDYVVFTDTSELSIYNAKQLLKETNPKYILISKEFKKSKSSKALLNYIAKNKLTYTLIADNAKYNLGHAYFSFPKIADNARGVILRNKHNTFVSTGASYNVKDKYVKNLPIGVEGYFATQGRSAFKVSTNVLDYIKPTNTILNDKLQVDNTESKKLMKKGALKDMYNVRDNGNIVILSDGVNYSITPVREKKAE